MAVSRFQADPRGFYERHNRDQTFERARQLRDHYRARRLGRATVWERFHALESIHDESDADLDHMSQLGHALQTAAAIRRDGLGEDWIVLGLVHDLGKLLQHEGEAPEFVVGDIFPLGCAFAPSIQFAEYFEANPDSRNLAYSTRTGIYEEGCGLDQVTFAYGHDQYLYDVLGDRLPPEIAWTVRYHSFRALEDYRWLLDESDRERVEEHLVPFARYDLYTKDRDLAPDELLPEFRELLERRFPDPIDW